MNTIIILLDHRKCCVLPKHTAWSEDLILELVGAAAADRHTLVVLQFNKIPCVVGLGHHATLINLRTDKLVMVQLRQDVYLII